MELKVDPGREVSLATSALPIAKACWPQNSPAPLISSFSLQAVAAAKEIADEWPRGLIFDRRPTDWADLGETMKLATFNGNHLHFTQETVSEMRSVGYAVLGYTVNEPERAAELFSWGVDAIFTDVPEIMLKAISS
jgi:glycerophosphoryl diester phosphodiesterase